MLAPFEPAADPFRPPILIDADGTVEGYASLFGAIDQARDMVMPGAFRATLTSAASAACRCCSSTIRAEPIGIWHELVEDWRGLRARGRLIPDVVRAREVLALLKAGAIDGLSIGFRTVKGRVDPRTRVRKLAEIDLWEISIVTFPLLDGARVRAVKQAPHCGRTDAQAHGIDERLLRRPPHLRFTPARAEREGRALIGAGRTLDKGRSQTRDVIA